MSDSATGGRAMTVGVVASLAGVTVRTLHHWDEVGLAGPSARTAAGYRICTAADITGIHRVFVYRELGVPLEEIARVLEADAPGRMAEARQEGVLLSAEEQVGIFVRTGCAMSSTPTPGLMASTRRRLCGSEQGQHL